MVRYAQRLCDAPSLNHHAFGENPISVQSEAGASPGWCASWKRGLITLRLQETSSLSALGFGERIKVTEDDCWQGC